MLCAIFRLPAALFTMAWMRETFVRCIGPAFDIEHHGQSTLRTILPLPAAGQAVAWMLREPFSRTGPRYNNYHPGQCMLGKTSGFVLPVKP